VQLYFPQFAQSFFLLPQVPFLILKVRVCDQLSQHNRRPFKAMALMSAILSQLVGSILIGIFAGRWCDQTFGTEPLFLIIGLLIGLAAGVFAMLRLVQHFFSGE
jgi:ATP synthase protein I